MSRTTPEYRIRFLPPGLEYVPGFGSPSWPILPSPETGPHGTLQKVPVRPPDSGGRIHFFGHDLGGTNVHVLIDLHGICRYDLSIHCLRQCNGKLCLADRSWAGQYD